MLGDIPTILQWYLALAMLGWIFIPLTARLFGWFVDAGYAFSKVVGILLAGYSVWLLASMSVVPFSFMSIVLILVVWGIVNINIWWADRQKKSSSSFFKRAGTESPRPRRLKLLLFEEALFLSALLFWAFVRGHEPSIRGLEKFMDYGFMNAILNTSYFPPHDMWLAPADNSRYAQGFFINYYYFGHYISAFLMRLSRIPAEIGYNLMLATVFGLSLTQAFSLCLNLVMRTYASSAEALKETSMKLRDLMAGLLGAFLVTLSGNLHTIYVFTSGYPNEEPVPFWQIWDFSNDSNYWYPNATRFIQNTIHEFPSYSWVVADLHGHVLDIPFVLLTIGVLLALSAGFWKKVTSRDAKKAETASVSIGFLSLSVQSGWFGRFESHLLSTDIRSGGIRIIHLLFLGFLTSVLYMTNAWDGLIYLALTVCLMALFSLRASTLAKKHVAIKEALTNTLVMTGIVIVAFILTGIAFNIHFKPFVSGFGVVGGWEALTALGMKNLPDVVKIGPFLFEKGNNLRSPLWMLAILWGFFYFNAVALVVYLVSYVRSQKPSLAESLRSWITAPYSGRSVHDRVAAALHRTIAIFTKRLRKTDVFVLSLVGISTLLLVFPEFFYAKDIYPGHYRANTMFKLGYQAFIMLSIVSTYSIVIIRNRLEGQVKQISPKTIALNLTTAGLLILVGIYPYFAVQSYYSVGENRSYEGLDGIQWLKDTYPGDYDTISYLNRLKSAPGTPPVILEGVGESYTDYSRISAYTGLQTPLGWPVHEWLWRGSYDEPGLRVEEVRAVYEAEDEESARTVLETYNVSYIVIGALERQKYTNLNEDLLLSLGEVAFSSGDTVLIQIQ